MRILIVAGEVSGDWIGALLARRLKRFDPTCCLVGLGGCRMAAAGVRLAFDSTRVGAIGLVEAVFSVPRAVGAFLKTRSLIERDRPDVAVLIACEHLNVPLAWWLKRKRIPTISYFPPQIWMWKKVLRLAPLFFDVVLAAFPEEFDLYKKTNCKVVFTGHYLKDIMRPTTDEDRSLGRAEFGLTAKKPILALLPGSRYHEVKVLVPVLLGAASRLRQQIPTIHFLLPVAQRDFRDLITAEVHQRDLRESVTLCEDSHQAMKTADVGLVASGTASLEAALLGLPHIVLYRVSPITWTAVRLLQSSRLVTCSSVGLPNLLAGQHVVPELLQEQANTANLVEETLALLNDEKRRSEMKRHFVNLANQLGNGCNLDRAVQVILSYRNLAES